jgi:hypothetical protein
MKYYTLKLNKLNKKDLLSKIKNKLTETKKKKAVLLLKPGIKIGQKVSIKYMLV